MIPDDLKTKLGNPGIWAYVKKENYDRAIAYMDEHLNEFHDKERGELEVKYKDFEYRDSIKADDFSYEPFNSEDIVVGIWRVDKKHKA